MKKRLIHILIFLTGFCYVASALELDSQEFVKNYENENNVYIAHKKSNFDCAFHVDIPAELPLIFVEYRTCPAIPIFDILPIYSFDPKPPHKIYLRLRVLRI